MTSGLFYLRCLQIGMTMADTDELTIGEIFDIFTEHANDDADYAVIATQEDFDRF